MKEFEKPKLDHAPEGDFGLRPRIIQAGCEFKLTTIVESIPPPTVHISCLIFCILFASVHIHYSNVVRLTVWEKYFFFAFFPL